MTEVSSVYNNSKFCNFCGRKEANEDLKVLIEGSGAYICDLCIYESLNTLKTLKVSKLDQEFLKPKEIKNFLDKYVVGQDSAKIILSVAVYNHFKRLYKTSSIELQKSNILLIGATGTGKTLLAQSLAKMLNVPFALVDATSITEAGYVGEDVETILQTLLSNCNFDVEKAQRGIIYIDELDKKARKTGANISISRDVSGEGVQRALLRMIEGAIVNVHPEGSRKHPNQKFIRIDTSNILFIFGGAFDGLVDVIAQREGQNNAGFLAEKTKLGKTERSLKLLKNVIHKDLITYGLIPELVGRIPVIATLDELDIDHLCKILIEPENALIKQYKEFLNMDNVKLTFKKDALKAIAEKAKKIGSGARGLRAIMEDLMINIMYEIPSEEGIQECIITKKCLENPKCFRRKKVA